MQVHRLVLLYLAFVVCLSLFPGGFADKEDVPSQDDDAEIEVESDTEVPEEKVSHILPTLSCIDVLELKCLTYLTGETHEEGFRNRRP